MTNSNNGALSGITAGLKNAYAYLSTQHPDGVTYNGITEIMQDSEKASSLNSTFAAYLQTNFNDIDSDKDGIISDAEMDRLTSLMAKAGLTKDEIMQMYASGASGLSSSTVDMISKYFDEIDTNKDGRVSSAEIAAFSVNSAKQEKLDEYAHQKATNLSTFYGSESSSVDSYSMLSYKYKSSKS